MSRNLQNLSHNVHSKTFSRFKPFNARSAPNQPPITGQSVDARSAPNQPLITGQSGILHSERLCNVTELSPSVNKVI